MQGMRDDRDIQWPKPASAPEKGRGPLCGKDRRRATVCPCRCVPTCYGFPAKVCQVACSTSHLTQNPGENVPGDTFLPSTWHGIPAKVFQVSFPAVHLLRNHHKSVPGGISCCPPGTASLPMFWRQFEQNTLYCHHDGRLSCIWKMKATERKPPDTSSQTQATMQLYDTVALWHDGRSYSSRIMIPSIGGTVTLICF